MPVDLYLKALNPRGLVVFGPGIVWVGGAGRQGGVGMRKVIKLVSILGVLSVVGFGTLSNFDKAPQAEPVAEIVASGVEESFDLDTQTADSAALQTSTTLVEEIQAQTNDDVLKEDSKGVEQETNAQDKTQTTSGSTSTTAKPAVKPNQPKVSVPEEIDMEKIWEAEKKARGAVVDNGVYDSTGAKRGAGSTELFLCGTHKNGETWIKFWKKYQNGDIETYYAGYLIGGVGGHFHRVHDGETLVNTWAVIINMDATNTYCGYTTWDVGA
jgi:hypothetical protein